MTQQCLRERSSSLSDNRVIEIVCTEETSAGYLMRSFGISARMTAQLKRTEGGITRNGLPCRTVDRLYKGDVLRLSFPVGEGNARPNHDLVIPVIFEDEDIIVFDKPAGVPVHRSQNHHDDTLENAFAARFPGAPFRGVNRLDKDTSGLCVAAKNRVAANMTLDEKIYFALCEGHIHDQRLIDAPIARAEGSAILRCVSPRGKPSQTLITPIRHTNSYTLLKVQLFTGRTHQIRVHLAHIGHPLAGDDMYGGKKGLSRHALHCGKIGFTHPVIGERMTFSSALPRDMCNLINDDL